MPLPLAGFLASELASVRDRLRGEKEDAAAQEGHTTPSSRSGPGDERDGRKGSCRVAGVSVLGVRGVRYPLRRWPRLSRVLLGGAGLVALALVAGNAYVLGADSESTGEVGEVPRVEVAIVPGALVEPSGEMSAMLAARVEQASRLWHAGRVEKVLVSGDHGSWAYDEPGTMRRALVRGGVDPEDVFEDHAGFDTWSTMVRARVVFEVDEAVVVTQGFHMPRALFLAEEAGIEATGLTSDPRDWGSQGRKNSVREVLSRVKAVADVVVGTPALAGPRIPIATSDGRESWGPAPPPGTPPAGSPDR